MQVITYLCVSIKFIESFPFIRAFLHVTVIYICVINFTKLYGLLVLLSSEHIEKYTK